MTVQMFTLKNKNNGEQLFLRKKKNSISEFKHFLRVHFCKGAWGYQSYLNYSASLAGEGTLLVFSSLLLMAYSVVSDTTGSNRTNPHDSE